VRWPEGEGEMRYCFDCDFVFAWPVLDGNPVQTYTRAYLGLEGRARMDEFAVRFRRRRIVTAKESLGIWSPAHRDAFRWLQTHVPRGSTLLEIGCGLGAVMRSLKQQGYRPAGVDVAKPVVDSLSKEGFPVWWGTTETLPDTWLDPAPAAVISFFVLHHLPAPIATLSMIRERWPVPLILGYNVSPTVKTAETHNFPPRTWGWWSGRSIEKALKRAGYSRIQVVSEPRVIAQLTLPPGLHAQVSRLLWRWPSLRVFAGRVADILLAVAFRLLRRSPLLGRKLEGSLLIVALPYGEQDVHEEGLARRAGKKNGAQP